MSVIARTSESGVLEVELTLIGNRDTNPLIC